MKKFICAALAAIMMTSAMVSCEQKEDTSLESSSAAESEGSKLVEDNLGKNDNITQENMPYGASITELKPSKNDRIIYNIDFDKRYFGGDEENPDYSEIYIIHDFIVALNKNDHDKMRSLYWEGYLEYESAQKGYEDVDAYLDDMYNTYVQLLGEGFEIDYINVSSCYNETDEEGERYFNMADKLISEVDNTLLTKIESKKVVEVGGYTSYETEKGMYQLVNHSYPIILRVYIIEGKAYLF